MKALLSAVCLGLLAAAGCGGGGGGGSVKPPSVTPAASVSLPLSASAPQGAITIMPLGDSITAGNGDPDGNGYRLPLWKDLTKSGFSLQYMGSQNNGSGSLPDTRNEGHPGYRIDAIAANIDGWLKNNQPQIILLMIGTNDVAQSYQLANAPDRLSALIDQILKDDPQANLLVASIPPITRADQDYAPRVQAYNAAISGIVQAEAAKGKPVHYVDVQAALTASDLVDGVHPNPQGYAKVGDAWFHALQSP